MQTALVVTAVASFLGILVLAGALESSLGRKWGGHIAAFLCLCVILWLGSVLLNLVFFSVSSTPDPRF